MSITSDAGGIVVYTAERRLYVNADRSKVVDEDSPEAAFLLVAEGGQVTDEEAARLGLTTAEPETAAEPETKAVETAPANKARSPKDTK